MPQPTVFISYSHKDEIWKDRLRPHLKVLEQLGQITIWDDRKIDAGATWYNEIEKNMAQAAVAVCLISADYLASDFINKEEIPYLLQRRERDGMLLLPILVKPCLWEAVSWLSAIQMLPRDGKSVSEDFQGKEDDIFREVAATIHKKINDPSYRPPAPPPPKWNPPEKIDINLLPLTGSELFGRDNDLQQLDEIWESQNVNVISLVAWGGVGKSTLVNKWLERLGADNYRGAWRVYGWSFYSQGTGERVTSADQFIAAALDWFGDPDPTKGSPWDKGERLAELVRQQKTLLILDGMEPLQSDLAFEHGKIKDPGLAVLVAELARKNNGLCVITTREPVADLQEVGAGAMQKNLEQISPQSGRALLRVGGVQGMDAELEKATTDFGNHALAINLLAAYLHDIPGHHISHSRKIPDLDVPEAKGKHPRRVMAAFEQRWGESPALQALRILGLFDRPAELAAVEAVRRSPAIAGLTDQLQNLTEGEWLEVLENLRQHKLLAPRSQHHFDTLDCHPLVREHFGEQLHEIYPIAWKKAHGRLYAYYKSQAKAFPGTIEEMVPLYIAVEHGCKAGYHKKVLTRVIRLRIDRFTQYFSTKHLGMVGAHLSALSHYFDTFYEKLSVKLHGYAEVYLRQEMANCLTGLGRLPEAAQVLRSLHEKFIRRKNFLYIMNATISTQNLSEIYLTLGDLNQAQLLAEQSLILAQRSGSPKLLLILLLLLLLLGALPFVPTNLIPYLSFFISEPSVGFFLFNCCLMLFLWSIFQDFKDYEQTGALTLLAEVLHQKGRMQNAESMFIKAEQLQRKRTQKIRARLTSWMTELLLRIDIALPLLAAQWGYRYCAFLLEGGQSKEVQIRASQTLKWAQSWGPRSRGLDHISLGLALLIEGQLDGTVDFVTAAEHLNIAVNELRRSEVDVVTYALLARATLHRARCALDFARIDLDKATIIATRGGMRLHEADCHLEYARLHLAMGEKDKARESWAKAKKMIEEMGYHRRDPEIYLIEAQLHLISGEKNKARESLAKAKELIDKMGMHRWDFEVKEIEEQLSQQ